MKTKFKSIKSLFDAKSNKIKPRATSNRRSAWKKRGWTQFNMGSGFIVPQNMPTADFITLQNQWNSILKDSGHVEIELRDPETGLYSSAFGKDGHSMTRMGSSNRASMDISKQKGGKEDYYRLLGLYRYHGNLKKDFGDYYKVRLFILEHTKEGHTLAAVGELAGTKAARGFFKPQKRSVYWTHSHLQVINRAMEAWVASKPEVLQPDWEPSLFQESNYENSYGEEEAPLRLLQSKK